MRNKRSMINNVYGGGGQNCPQFCLRGVGCTRSLWTDLMNIQTIKCNEYILLPCDSGSILILEVSTKSES